MLFILKNVQEIHHLVKICIMMDIKLLQVPISQKLLSKICNLNIKMQIMHPLLNVILFFMNK